MSSADERYVMVYNGEMYNFHSLREELEQVGKRFRTQSDTEVLLEAYGYWGATCLSKFHGMFALAVYDRLENELFLARDRTGIKPLYYATLDGAFCFASEIKALHQLSARSLTLNYAATSAPTPHVFGASCTITTRPVRRTDATSASVSIGFNH